MSENVLYQMKEINKRFDRVEAQLDQVQSAIVQMARTEEQVSTVLKQNTSLFAKMDNLQERVTTLEKHNATNRQSLNFFERLGWVLATAFIGGLAWFTK